MNILPEDCDVVLHSGTGPREYATESDRRVVAMSGRFVLDNK